MSDKRQQAIRAALREAHEVGCDGLVGGTALQARTWEPVFAETAIKADGPFICEACLSDAVLRKCTEKIDHFAHKARLSPVVPRGEKDLHSSCKREICDALKTAYPDGKWATERELPARPLWDLGKLRPDISGRIDGTRVAIEIQASFLTVPRILKRALGYTERGIHILWIVPLVEDLGDQPFRPRLYERYLHSMYFGRTYYWRPGFGATVLPVNYQPATRYIERRTWFADGEEQEAGGYDAYYKTIKRPNPGRQLDIGTDFHARRRKEHTPYNERKTVPPVLLWRDSLEAWSRIPDSPPRLKTCAPPRAEVVEGRICFARRNQQPNISCSMRGRS